MMRPTATYDGVTVNVESDGVLSMIIPGDVFRRDAVLSGGSETTPAFDLEVWSDDPTMDVAPQLRATVTQGTEVIGNGAVFLREWPLVLGATTSVSSAIAPAAARASGPSVKPANGSASATSATRAASCA